jgi:hypothetical protein
MKKTTFIISLTVLLASAWGVRAHDMKDMKEAKSALPEASAAFQQIQKLKGTWKGTVVHGGKDAKPEPVITEFKLTAAGSAVQETLMKGTPDEMVDMYFDEGGRLTMTHYCAMGNRPQMYLRQSDPSKVVLEMMMAPPGIDPTKDTHMHALTLEFPDNDHLNEKWISYTDGKPGDPTIMKMARVK